MSANGLILAWYDILSGYNKRLPMKKLCFKCLYLGSHLQCITSKSAETAGCFRTAHPALEPGMQHSVCQRNELQPGADRNTARLWLLGLHRSLCNKAIYVISSFCLLVLFLFYMLPRLASSCDSTIVTSQVARTTDAHHHSHF